MEGRIFIDPSLPGMTPSDRIIALHDTIRILSNIHRLPLALNDSTSLDTFGQKGQYVSRQVQRLLQVSSMQGQSLGYDDPILSIEQDFKALGKYLNLYASYCPDHVSLIHGMCYIIYSFVPICISMVSSFPSYCSIVKR